MVSLYLGDTYKLRGPGRGGVSVSGVRGSSFRLSTTTPTCVDYRLHCRNFSVSTKETIQVYSHLGTYANTSCELLKIQD